MARLVRLERIAGYDDLITADDKYRWRRGRDQLESARNRPVLASDIKAWLVWSAVDREITERLRLFTYNAVTEFLKKDGWEPSTSSSYSYDTTEGRGEEWRFVQQGDLFYTSGRRSIHERAIVPRAEMHDDRRVYHFWNILSLVQHVRSVRDYAKFTIPQLVAEVETFLNPLTQLAMQAEP